MCTGKLAFKNNDSILAGFKGKIGKPYSPELQLILDNMLRQDPKERWDY